MGLSVLRDSRGWSALQPSTLLLVSSEMKFNSGIKLIPSNSGVCGTNTDLDIQELCLPLNFNNG